MAENWVVMYNATEQVQDVVAGSHAQFTVRDKTLFADFFKLIEASKE